MLAPDAAHQENHQGEGGPVVRHEGHVHEGGDLEVLQYGNSDVDFVEAVEVVVGVAVVVVQGGQEQAVLWYWRVAPDLVLLRLVASTSG